VTTVMASRFPPQILRSSAIRLPLFKIANKEVVKDLPKMKDTGKGVCGPCQLGKQTRAAHKKTSGIITSRNLELFHMDLMGPT